MALTTRQSVLPTAGSFEALPFAHTVPCPSTSSAPKSLETKDLEARAQQLLLQARLDGSAAPLCILISTLENTVQYFPVIIYSS